MVDGEILRRLDALEAVVARLLRVGVVTNVYPERGTVRVELPDVHAGGTALITRELPVVFDKTFEDKQIRMPDVGEHVVCMFLPSGAEHGFVLGAFYSEPDTVPVASPDKRHILFNDGSWFEYDRAAHKLSGHVVGGDAELTVDKNVKVDVGGDADLTVGGELTAVAQGQATLESAVTVLVTAPLIQLAGNITSGAQGGGVNTEIKTSDIEHTGSEQRTGDRQHTGNVAQVGNHVIEGHLHVTSLTVDAPIIGILA